MCAVPHMGTINEEPSLGSVATPPSPDDRASRQHPAPQPVRIICIICGVGMDSVSAECFHPSDYSQLTHTMCIVGFCIDKV